MTTCCRLIDEKIPQENVLVSRSGEPVLAGFGLSRILKADSESRLSESLFDDTFLRQDLRWLPYEYHHIPSSEKFRPNPKTDVWAFGMTLLVRSKNNV